MRLCTRDIEAKGGSAWTVRPDNAWVGGKVKTDCWGMVPHWDGKSNMETTAASRGRDRGCEPADSRDAVRGRLLLDLRRCRTLAGAAETRP